MPAPAATGFCLREIQQREAGMEAALGANFRALWQQAVRYPERVRTAFRWRIARSHPVAAKPSCRRGDRVRSPGLPVCIPPGILRLSPAQHRAAPGGDAVPGRGVSACGGTFGTADPPRRRGRRIGERGAVIGDCLHRRDGDPRDWPPGETPPPPPARRARRSRGGQQERFPFARPRTATEPAGSSKSRISGSQQSRHREGRYFVSRRGRVERPSTGTGAFSDRSMAEANAPQRFYSFSGIREAAVPGTKPALPPEGTVIMKHQCILNNTFFLLPRRNHTRTSRACRRSCRDHLLEYHRPSSGLRSVLSPRSCMPFSRQRSAWTRSPRSW